MRRTSRSRGVTLVESSIVVAVLAIVAAGAVPGFAGFIGEHRAVGAARQLAADIDFARSEALLRNRSIRLSVLSTPVASCYVVHTGTAAQCACAATTATCSGGAVALKSAVFDEPGRLTVTANVSSMLFDPLHGTVSPTGTLRVVDARGRAIHHIVNIVGRVRSCAAGATVAGYAAC